MSEKIRDTGIDIIGKAPWGTHFCQFYSSGYDLLDILVPYFKAGLENNEFCMWITSEPVTAEEAEQALRKVIPDLDRYIENHQLEIIEYDKWYVIDGSFDSDRVLAGWVEKLNAALERGLEGLRLTGNTFWLEKEDWNDFTDYEFAVDSVIGQYPMLALCTYHTDKCGVSEVADVISNHQFALIKRSGKWEAIESSERKRAEIAIRESENKYRLLFTNLPFGSAYHKIVVDENNKPIDYIFVEVNEAFETQTGLRREDVIGKRVTEVMPGIQDSEFDWIGTYGKVTQTGENIRFEQYSEPLERWYSVSAYSPIPDHFVAIFMDVTAQKKWVDKISAVNEELTHFAYSVSHDMKSPLIIITEYLNLIKEDPTGFDEYQKAITEQIQSMSQYIENLLKLSLAGKAIDTKTEIDLSFLLQSMFTFNKPRDVEAEFSIKTSLPSVMGDPDRMGHVFMNLLENSIQHRDPSKGKLIIEVEHHNNASGTIICFRDNGKGIDSSILKDVFKAGFSRGKKEGTGFGLAIARKIVEAHGGRIWAESKGINQGAEFYIKLPLAG